MSLILSDPPSFSLPKVLISQLFPLTLPFPVGSFSSAFKYALVSQAKGKIKKSPDPAVSI